jgi:ABC-type sugar transport system substrate-binding protein
VRTSRWLTLSAIVAFTATACSAAAPTAAPTAKPTAAPTVAPTPAPTAPPTPEPTIGRIKIGFVTHVIGNPFIQQIIDGANDAASDLNVELQVTGPEGGDANAQLTAVQTLVAAGAQGIATSVPGESMSSALNAIVATGIPVVQFNLLITSVHAPYVGERSVQSGRILGQKVVDKLGGASATGKVIIGNCFPGFPVLENRAKGVRESLAKAPGLTILPKDSSGFDVKVAANENYAAWEALLAANTDAKALVGLCAPDIASLGKLQEANKTIDFVAGGYDLTSENLAALGAGNADISLGQTPFMQGYLPVKMLADAIRNKIDLSKGGFLDAGTEIVTPDSVTEPFGLPPLTFAGLQELAGSPFKTRQYYQPLVDGVIKDWQTKLEPIENESK